MSNEQNRILFNTNTIIGELEDVVRLIHSKPTEELTQRLIRLRAEVTALYADAIESMDT